MRPLSALHLIAGPVRIVIAAAVVFAAPGVNASTGARSAIAHIDSAATAPAATTSTHPLVWAQQVPIAALDQYGEAELFLGAKWLDNWGKLAAQAPVSGSPAEYLAGHRKAKVIFEHLRTRNPNEPAYWAANAGALYNIGEMVVSAPTERRLALYKEMVELTTTCVERVDPDYAYCWLLMGVAYGRLGTTRGVLSSAFLADDVEGAWKKTMAMNPPGRNFTGDPITVDTRYGLSTFYRMVPDRWLVKLITGTRGDKAKSVRLIRTAAAIQPYRLELQKELAVALLCFGADEDDADAIRSGKALLNDIITGKFDRRDVRATDEIDKRHARQLLANPPERACGYSRDGFQDLSEKALKKAKQEYDQ